MSRDSTDLPTTGLTQSQPCAHGTTITRQQLANQLWPDGIIYRHLNSALHLAMLPTDA